jgi:hypothetical protein
VTSADEIRRGYSPQKLTCTDREHRPEWVVIVRYGNYSAFNGHHFTPSDYSLVKCRACNRHWRTKAAYVGGLPDAARGED